MADGRCSECGTVVEDCDPDAAKIDAVVCSDKIERARKKENPARVRCSTRRGRPKRLLALCSCASWPADGKHPASCIIAYVKVTKAAHKALTALASPA